jgi:hypothetical protein
MRACEVAALDAALESGTFVSTVDIVAPPVRDLSSTTSRLSPQTVQQVTYIDESVDGHEIAYEVQELSVELGRPMQVILLRNRTAITLTEPHEQSTSCSAGRSRQAARLRGMPLQLGFLGGRFLAISTE